MAQRRVYVVIERVYSSAITEIRTFTSIKKMRLCIDGQHVFTERTWREKLTEIHELKHVFFKVSKSNEFVVKECKI